MPYASTTALPTSVRNHLPHEAQEIYIEAFNHAWTTYADRPNREQICHRVAWSAVKRSFHKELDGMWRPNLLHFH